MELVSLFKMNTVTENYWLIYATAMDLISHCVNLKLALQIPCPVDHDDIVPLMYQSQSSQ